MCQPGKVMEWHGLRGCRSFGERYRCLQPRPEQVQTAARVKQGRKAPITWVSLT
jgi:hypothetical protein